MNELIIGELALGFFLVVGLLCYVAEKKGWW